MVLSSQQATLRFRVHDMRRPFGAAQYQLVTNLFTSFGYFDSEEHNRTTLSAIAEALVPGGSVVIDYLNPAPILPKFPYEGVLEKGGTVFYIRKWADESFIYKNIGFMDGDEWKQYDEQVQLLTPDWFRKHLLAAGLAPQAFFGDYELGPYTASSPRQIVVARKLSHISS